MVLYRHKVSASQTLRAWLVGRSLLDGYRRLPSQNVLTVFHEHHALYETITLPKSMNSFEVWFADIPTDQINPRPKPIETKSANYSSKWAFSTETL